MISRHLIEVTFLNRTIKALLRMCSELQLHPYLDDLRCKLPLFPVYCPGVGTYTKMQTGTQCTNRAAVRFSFLILKLLTKEFSHCAKCSTTFFSTWSSRLKQFFCSYCRIQVTFELTWLALFLNDIIDLGQSVGYKMLIKYAARLRAGREDAEMQGVRATCPHSAAIILQQMCTIYLRQRPPCV